MRTLLPFLFVSAVLGCGGTQSSTASSGGSSSGGSSSGGSSSGGSSGILGDAGLPSVTCGNDNVSSIQGTWDLIASRPGGDQGVATMTIDAGTFSFASGGKSLVFTASGPTMTLLWTDATRQVPISTTHSDAPVDVGLVPLALGGQWSFMSTTDAESCSASLGANGFNATCNDVRSTPFGTLRDTVVGQRSQKLDSIFGELGGTWHLAAGGGGGADVEISGNTFTAKVENANGTSQGSVQIKVCEGTASGVTSDGFEISGTRQ
jgi:hypothetical protein